MKVFTLKYESKTELTVLNRSIKICVCVSELLSYDGKLCRSESQQCPLAEGCFLPVPPLAQQSLYQLPMPSQPTHFLQVHSE